MINHQKPISKSSPQNIPNELSIMAPRVSTHPTRTHTMEDRPDFLAIRFMTGKIANIGKHVDSPARETRLYPNRRKSIEKNDIWNTPVIAPYAAKIRPIVFGGKPRPPISIGIAKKRGKSAYTTMFKNESAT